MPLPPGEYGGKGMPPPLGYGAPGPFDMDSPPGHFNAGKGGPPFDEGRHPLGEGGAPPHLAPGGPFEPPAQLALPAPEGPATSEAAPAAARSRSRRRRRRRDDGVDTAAEDAGQERRRRRRREEDPAQGPADISSAVTTPRPAEPSRTRRRSVAAADETPADAPTVASAPVAAVGAAPSAASFLDRLPDRLTRGEEELGEAVLQFLRDWSSRGAGGAPNMVHVGGDVRVRDFKAAALPAAVSLKAWLKQRFHHRVEVRGQSIVALEE